MGPWRMAAVRFLIHDDITGFKSRSRQLRSPVVLICMCTGTIAFARAFALAHQGELHLAGAVDNSAQAGKHRNCAIREILPFAVGVSHGRRLRAVPG
jgi:hypothetical protein